MQQQGHHETPLTSDLVPDFGAAEAAAEEAVQAILEDGAQQLYEVYLQSKSFSFAANATCEVISSDLQLCFVRHDEGEQDSASWQLEDEPPQRPIDTWARCVVPIRKKVTQPKHGATEEVGHKRKATLRMARLTSSASSHFSTARIGPTMMAATGAGDGSPDLKGNGRPQVIPLVETKEVDEEEAALREMKERELRRQREEEARIAKKAQEEADEASKLAQVYDQTKNKPFTFDSDGNLIWVQPFNIEKLPVTHPAPSVAVKKDPGAEDGHRAAAKRRGMHQQGSPRKNSAPRGQRKKEESMQESFKKFEQWSQQPKMVDAMSLAPGVILKERGKQKAGDMGASGRTMSRKEYKDLVDKGSGPLTSQQLHSMTEISEQEKKDEEVADLFQPSEDVKPRETVPPPIKESSVGAGSGEAATITPAAPSQISGATATAEQPDRRGSARTGSELARPAATSGVARARSRDGGPSMKIVRAPDLGAELLDITPQPPTAPRPMQPAPPLEIRRAVKQQALGYVASTRERLPPPSAPSPRLMGPLPTSPLARPPSEASPRPGLSESGHLDASGLLQNTPRIPDEPRQASATPRSARSHGQIVSKNPDLVKRLFPL
mmetsp:Transcript_68872/g.165318  ORF Transcript_68872/g.165318 Transcript_68872/m.165318 type:complete len:608 (-) Transcript_68872:73-1896(-)